MLGTLMRDRICQGLHENTQQSGVRIADTGHGLAMQDVQDVGARNARHISQICFSALLTSLAPLLMPTRTKIPQNSYQLLSMCSKQRHNNSHLACISSDACKLDALLPIRCWPIRYWLKYGVLVDLQLFQIYGLPPAWRQ